MPRRPPPPAARPKPAPTPPRAKVAPVATSLEPLPTPGHWIWTCREGFERDLVEELVKRGADRAPRQLAPSLVATRGAPALENNALEVTFARQGFALSAAVRASNALQLETRVTAALREATAASGAPWLLQVWVPDSTHANPFARSAEVLSRAIEQRAAALDAAWADRRAQTTQAVKSTPGAMLGQVCLVEPGLALVGAVEVATTLSLHVGGRARMRVAQAAPSRAAMKLEEALDWLGLGPERGEVCVDLGAAPGGWTYVLLERGARVIAVDPGAMAPELAARRALSYVKGSAFDYEPDVPVDWLLCDMVWRPLEVAALLARWAKRRWARFVVANIKMPMRGKVEFLDRVRAILVEGGWRDVRIRQLYHDREEVTLSARAAQ